MEIKYESADDCIYAELSGELDECSAEYVRISLDDLLNGKTASKSKLVLDFSKVSFMDSTGIGMLLGRYNKFSRQSINIYIKNPTSYVNRIFEMTGIYQIIPKVC
ncbi:MAG: STAS domain-containing protein [Clostridia bacterium]|nr:STAS domain-containing protein [Clostridia bacterium]